MDIRATAGADLTQLLSSLGVQESAGNQLATGLDNRVGGNRKLAREVLELFGTFAGHDIAGLTPSNVSESGFCPRQNLPGQKAGQAHEHCRGFIRRWEKQQLLQQTMAMLGAFMNRGQASQLGTAVPVSSELGTAVPVGSPLGTAVPVGSQLGTAVPVGSPLGTAVPVATPSVALPVDAAPVYAGSPSITVDQPVPSDKAEAAAKAVNQANDMASTVKNLVVDVLLGPVAFLRG